MSIINFAQMSHRADAVYKYLHGRADAKGTCWPSIRTIARELKLSRSTVKRAINDLVESGHLKKEYRYRENGSKTSNLFIIS